MLRFAGSNSSNKKVAFDSARDVRVARTNAACYADVTNKQEQKRYSRRSYCVTSKVPDTPEAGFFDGKSIRHG